MKTWRRIIAAILCLTLVMTTVNIEPILNKINASEPDSIISVEDIDNVEIEDTGGGSELEETETDMDDNLSLPLEDNQKPPLPIGSEEGVYSVGDRIGYHVYNGVEYPNMYMVYYSPNDGDGEYEKENHQYRHNEIYSMHFYNHGTSYNGLPVYSVNTDPSLIVGEKGVAYLIDDLTLTRNVYNRDNYNFIGWNEDKNADTVQFYDAQYIDNLTTEDNGIIQLYAIWEKAQTSFNILKNGGTFDWDSFYTENNISSESVGQDGDFECYEMPDGSILKIKETEDQVYFEADCLTTIKIPDMLIDDNTLAFVGFDTSTKNWDANEKTFFFENKNSKPSMKALFLSSLTLDGVVDIHGYDGEGSVSLQWGTLGSDDIGKVYKIAQSFDGENFEYIPDQNFVELIEGLTYRYTGSVQTFTAPIAGKYYIEAWGANGGIGYTTDYPGGNGGKTAGYVNLKEGQTIYLYVGEAGKTYAEAGTQRSYGGGGAAPVPSKIWRPQGTSAWQSHVQGRGGGATYVSLTEKELSDYVPENYTSISPIELNQIEQQAVASAKEHVLMVAAGGSGRGDGTRGADGGGLIGPTVVDTDYFYGTVNKWTATGATQESAGYGDFGTLNGMSDDYYYRTPNYGTFFYGSSGMTCSGAGGGGWFGGGMCYYTGGSGASSYLGEDAGLYDAETIIGGNKENVSDAAEPWNINGKVRIKICDYWITTNTSEKIYSPDKEAPDTPVNVDSVLDNPEQGTGTVTWDVSDDNGSDYWYRVDAFDSDDFSLKISESEVKQFNVTSGTTGYYYVIDEWEDTIAHPGNGTFTENISISDIEMLDVGRPKYIHICAVDDAGNYSGTTTIMLNRVTVVVDPNKGGTYNGSYDVQSFILNSGDVYNVNQIIENENQKFVDWVKTTGDGIFDKEAGTITTLYAKTTIVASYMAPLILEAKVDYVMNNKKGAIDLQWNQDDEINKTYKVYITDREDGLLEPIRVAVSADVSTTNFSYQEEGYQTYEVPGDGIYTLTAYGAAGGDFGSYKGGSGTKVTGTFSLKKGDTLYIFTGGQGTNGGGAGSAEGAAGGGATDIRLNGTAVENRILIAAGGSGANKTNNGVAETAGQPHNGVLFSGTDAASDISEPKIEGKLPMNEAPSDYNINVSGGGGGLYGGTAGYKKAKAEQKRIDDNDYNTLTETILSWVEYKALRVKPNLLTSTPITVTSYSVVNTGNFSQNGVCPTTLVGKKVWLYQLDSVTVNGTDYYRYAYDGDDGFRLNGVLYGPNIGVWVADSKPDSILVAISLAPTGASGWHVRNMPWPNPPAANGDKNSGNISTIKMQTYVWKSPSYNTGLAGVSYVDNNKGTTEETVYGNNAGNGHASITVYDYSSGDQDKTDQDGVIAIDYAAPDAPYGGRILSSDGTNAVLTWVKPDDNGTPYWNKAESYYADTLEKINDSNVTMTNVITGVEKYRWYSDYNEEGTVTGTNSVEAATNNIQTESSNLTMYYHVAAVDYAGNIGPTYTFNPIEGIDIEVTVIWDDKQNELFTRPSDAVSVSIYKMEDTDGDGVPEKVVVQTLPLSSYDDTEKLLFEHLPSVDEDGNVIRYMAEIDGVVSDNSFYDYMTSYSEDTYTITNKIEEINKSIHVKVEWDDKDNELDTRPDRFLLEVLDSDGNVVKRIEVNTAETDIDIPVSLGHDFTINVTGINSKHPENPYTTTIKPNGTDEFVVKSVLDYQLTVIPDGGMWQGSKDNQDFTLKTGESMVLEDPIRTGYTFTGWEIEGEGTLSGNTVTIGKGNVTVTAKWEKTPYKLTVDPNGGIFESSRLMSQYTMYYGDKRIITVPERFGYTFIGWTVEGTGMVMTSLTERSLLTMGASDALLRANWVPRKIMVTLDPQGGTVEQETLEVTYETPYGPIPVPVKPGCEFISWALDPEGKYPVDESSIVEINEDHVLYAQYMPNTIEINGKVVWVDEDNVYNTRPDSLKVDILTDGEYMTWAGSNKANGVSVATVKDDWVFYKEMLQEYDITENRKLEYSVILNPETVASENFRYFYETSYSVDEDGTFIITNTMKPVTTDIKVRVEWDDENNTYGSRPENLDVDILTNGEYMLWNHTTQINGETVTTSDPWVFIKNGLQKYDPNTGEEIDYTVRTSSESVASMNSQYVYETTYSKDDDGTLVIKNTMKPATIDLKGRVVWVDEDNAYGTRPDELDINILSDGEHFIWNWREKEDGITLNVSSPWDFYKNGVQEYDLTTGEKIDYSVVFSHETVASKNIRYVYETTYSVDKDGSFIITNTMKPKTNPLNVRVEWIDNNNQFGERPESLDVRIFTDGNFMTWNNKTEEAGIQKTVTEGNWSFTLDNMQEYNLVAGNKIVYTAQPNPLPVQPKKEQFYYTTDYEVDTGGTLVIKITPHPVTTGISGKVIWVDENNKFGTRPSELRVDILADGEFVTKDWLEDKEGSFVMTKADTWTFTKDGLQKYDLSTDEAIGYNAILDPSPAESLNVMYAYDTQYEISIVDGKPFVTITNTMYEAKADLIGTLAWVDKSNAWGSRPEEVVVVLYADGEEVLRTTLSSEDMLDGNGDVWGFVFEKMQIYNNDGSEIKYTVKVNPDPTPSNNDDDAYEVSYDGLNITETLVNANKKVSGTITWIDDNDRYHYRPESTVIVLYAGKGTDRKEVARIEVPSDVTDFEFESLPKYDNNYNLIKYSIEEIIDKTYVVRIEETPVKNASGIVDSSVFDVYNTFVYVSAEKPYTKSEVYMKVVYEDEDRFDEIGFSKQGTTFPVRLYEMEKIFTGENGSYEVSYGDKTGNVYSTVLTDKYVHIEGLWPGKYLIDIEIRPQFEFVNMLSFLEDGAEIVDEGGKWYLIISPEAKDATIHIDAVVKPVWRGYCDRYSIYNYFKA